MAKEKQMRYMKLPNNLKFLRNYFKYDIAYIAKYCKTTKRKVWAWEHGLSQPTIFQLECLTVAYDTSMDFLCGTLKSKNLIANRPIHDKEVTVEEMMYVRIYRSIGDEYKNFVENFMNFLMKKEIRKYEKFNQALVELEDIIKCNDFEKFASYIEKYRNFD